MDPNDDLAAGLYHNFFIHPNSIVDGNIGEGSKVWHYSHICYGAKIGKNCKIGQGVYIGEDVIIGDGCKIQNMCSIGKGVKMGNHVFVGPGVIFTNVRTPYADIEQKDNFLDTIIQDGVTIGANATIMCGIEIGKDAFIGMGSVVIRDVPEKAKVFGNPARIIGENDKKVYRK
jgi:UDP-2-acetamido-3-amino-2,3-dideoxy-glucuronate N-acetyltransferase